MTHGQFTTAQEIYLDMFGIDMELEFDDVWCLDEADIYQYEEDGTFSLGERDALLAAL